MPSSCSTRKEMSSLGTPALRTKGYRADEIIGQHFSRFYMQEDIQRGHPDQELRDAAAQGRSEDEGWRVRKDGTKFWANVVISALRDESGALLGFSKITRDNTLKKLAEENARRLLEAEAKRKAAEEHAEDAWAQREQLAVTLQSIGDGVITTDVQGRVTMLNSVAQKLIGWNDEAVGRPLAEVFRIVHEETRRKVENPVERVLREGAVIGLANHTLLISRDGAERPIADSAAPIRDKRNEIIGVVMVFRDFSERRRAEEQLRLQDRAIQAVSQGILITDPRQPENPIIYASRGFERMTGYRSDEVLGRNCRFLQGKSTDPETVAALREAIRTERECSVELLNYRKDGTSFWNALFVTPLRDEQGALLHFVGVLADVTERRVLEQAFHQSQKMESVGHLAGGVAHDFNNLLTVILGDCEFLEQDVNLSADSRELTQEIHKTADQAATLTRQLLAFSRKQILQPKVLDLNDVMVGVGKMLGRLIGEDIALKTNLSSRLWRVKIDVGQIEQVLVNLAVNARDAMPRGGSLTIETANIELDETAARSHPDVKPGPYVVISVRDTGCGMDERTLARLFEPFFTTKAPGKGTGLGLATVFGIVKQSDGHIAVSSKPGEGTTFRLYFPRAQITHAERPQRKPLPDEARGAETVLVVEDADAVRGLACRTLRAFGYTVLEAASGGQALLICQQHPEPIHLVVTDVVMPEMSGRQLSEHLKERHPGIQLLFMSGYTNDAVVRHGVFEAETDFLQKPFLPAALAQKVREILDRRG